MKKTLILVLLALSTAVSATTYYIDTAGTDNASRNGTSQPWKTLAYACTRVTSPGDVIHINAGTYDIASKIIVPVGISIEGAGVTSVITTGYAGSGAMRDATISFESYVEGTIGNQSIHDLKFDGKNLAGKAAIAVRCRGKVNVYNCTFINFSQEAAIFYGGAGSWGASDAGKTYSEGNTFHDNITTNCSRNSPPATWDNTGHVLIQGQKDLLIYNNTMTQTHRAPGSNGMLVKGVEGFYKGMKIYNNTMTQTPAGNEVGFSMELWYLRGGCEIYNNNISLCVDIARGIIKGSYPFSVKVYDNTIGNATGAYSSSPYGVLLEWDNQDVYIYKNLIWNVRQAITISSCETKNFERIHIYYNIFKNIGSTSDGCIFFYTEAGAPCTFNNMYIYNNVMHCKVNGGTRAGVGLPRYGTCTNFFIKNNIIENSSLGAVWGRYTTATMSNLVIQNNIFFGNANADNVYFENGYSPLQSNYINSGNIKSDPLFTDVSSGNFQLKAGSPAIKAGLDVGLTLDYKGNMVGNPPDIGALTTQPVTSAIIPVYTSTVVENTTPSRLDMNYNVSLTNTTPAASSFTVKVNSVARAVNSVAVSGTKVLLTLPTAVAFGDVVTVTYTKCSVNPLQTTTGGQAVSIIDQSVTNKCLEIISQNDPPVAVIKNETINYSGFVGELDASGSYDKNNDILTYEWIVPDSVSVSSTNSQKIQFLAPVVTSARNFEFQLTVNDGKVKVSKSISINIMPYKPELKIAKTSNIEASSYNIPDYPVNAADGNIATKWSVDGDNHWLIFKLAGPLEISHLEIAFLQGQKYESYFDIFASKDNLIWEPILNKTASCNFSGDFQVFDFPATKSGTEYAYIKLVGHGNSLNTLNSFSELKTYGFSQVSTNSDDTRAKNITIYPNPAHDFFNISIKDPTVAPQIIKIVDLSGRIVHTDAAEQGIQNVQIPENLKSGIYIVTLQSENLILYTQRLIVNK